MWKWEEGARGAVEKKKWSTGYPPPKPFLKNPSVWDFCVSEQTVCSLDRAGPTADWWQGCLYMAKAKERHNFVQGQLRDPLPAPHTREDIQYQSWSIFLVPFCIMACKKEESVISQPFVVLFLLCLRLQMCLGLPHHNLAPASQNRELSFSLRATALALFLPRVNITSPDSLLLISHFQTLLSSEFRKLLGSATWLQNLEETTGQF